MRRKSHVRFCSGGGVGDHPTDRNHLTPAAVGSWVAKYVWPQAQVTFFVRRRSVNHQWPTITEEVSR